jgi:hypothetical protein
MRTFAYLSYRFSRHDEHPRLRHYDYGRYIYSNDEDGSDLMYEHDGISNCAIYEEKHGSIKTIDLKKFGLLAERARLRDRTLYCFINIYYYYKRDGMLLHAHEHPNDLSLFDRAEHIIIGLNKKTVNLMTALGYNRAQLVSEAQWVGILARCRENASNGRIGSANGISLPDGLTDEVLYGSGEHLRINNQEYVYDD